MIQGSRELSKEIIIFVSHHIDYDINEDYHFMFLRIDRILFLPSWLPKYDDFIELLDGGSRTLLFILKDSGSKITEISLFKQYCKC